MPAIIRILFFLLLTHVFFVAQADEAVPEYAKNFSITEYPTFKLLTVRNAYRDASGEFKYALVPKDASLPEDLPKDVTLIRTPVERVALMETVYIGYLDAINRLESIHATATARYISHPKVVARIASGNVRKLQSGQELDIEQLLLLQPDAIFTTTLGKGAFQFSPEIERAGLPLVVTADYMERHPLARTEWIKFIAAFYHADAEATKLFDQIRSEYIRLKGMTESITDPPRVFCGAPYSGVWHVPGGGSYIAQLILDAGGDYGWSEDCSQGSIPLDTERVFLKAADADYWINPSHYRSLDELLSADSRFAKFQAVQRRQVFNNTKQEGPSGGNNIWEAGIMQPEVILADMIQIFHPARLPEREMVYHMPLR
jgi:iron complex transport system substrate-binding protein